MKTKIVFLSSLFFILISCNSSGTFYQFDKMPENNRWMQTDVKVYEFEVKDDTKRYNIVFEFSHVYDYQFDSIPIQFMIKSPDGKEENLAVDLQLKDSSGKQLAECSGDVCDLKYTVKKQTRLNRGTYKIIVSHNFKAAPFLPNVIGIGLSVNP
jgi:gliding motility-associated lipoprotein GldH